MMAAPVPVPSTYINNDICSDMTFVSSCLCLELVVAPQFRCGLRVFGCFRGILGDGIVLASSRELNNVPSCFLVEVS